jgi:hypothetical protein
MMHSVAAKDQSLSVLSSLKASHLLRTYFISAISSSPRLLDGCSFMLSRMINSRWTFLDIEKNKLIQFLLKKTVYAQFCAGQTPHEVHRTKEDLDNIGYHGVILEYGLETVDHDSTGTDGKVEDSSADICTWRDGMMKSLEMTRSGDFLGLK